MMTLVRICGEHWHAVERDLLSLNWIWERSEKRFRHITTDRELSLWQLASIVMSSPPGSAVYHAETRSGSMTPEQQMLASMSGYQAPQSDSPVWGASGASTTGGIWGADAVPPSQVPQIRTKADSFAALPNWGGMKLDALPVDELVKKREEMASRIRESKGANASERTVLDRRSAYGKVV